MDSRDARQLHQSSSHDTLTGQVSQPEAPTQHQTLESIPLHPLNLNFPTLNDDGSIPDLTAHQSAHRSYPPTPPAALSSLGIRAKMAGKEAMSDSGSSFADSQYDMIDDLSDVSNDDHDTASIASHDGPSGQLTPDYAQSEADDTEEQTESLHHTDTAIPSPSFESFVALSSPSSRRSASPSHAVPTQSKLQMKAENDLIDSYTSEDLETPRQSTMPNAFASTYRLSQRMSADRATHTVQTDQCTNHILFISDRDMPVLDMEVICARAAYGMDVVDPSSALEYTIKRLPATPSGMQQASFTVICGGESASATVQHCISAERRENDSYKLQILDSDDEHSSFYTIGQDAKIDLQPPQLAIFYLDAFTHGMAWFDTALSAVQSLNVPILVIRDSDLTPAKSTKIGNQGSGSQLILDSKHFMDIDRAELPKTILKIIGKDQAPSPSRASNLEASVKEKSTGNSLSFRVVLMLLALLLPITMLSTRLSSTANSEVGLAVRREALTFALDKLAISANITKTFNVEHLMPPVPGNCTQASYLGLPLGFSSCPVQVHAENAPPNHAIVSFQNGLREPRVTSAKIHRDDDRELNVTCTKLMPGVYHIALDPNEAYGNVNFNIITTRPPLNISWSSNFGNRLLQRKTYERASTDLSKIVSKDVAVMRHAAKGITEKVTTEIGAGLWATKNVTSQLAMNVGRDVQLAASTAISVFSNVAKVGNKTASSLGKDLVLMQKGVTNFGEHCSKSFKSRMALIKANSKALIRAPLNISKQKLALSRQRLQDLKKVLQPSSAKKAAVPQKKSLLDRLENSLAATPEHELLKKHARQAKAAATDWARNVNDFKERTKKQKKSSGIVGKRV